ncbi:hypothetical protein Fuma_03277 [Fuerstiella marisgermanici]|uniref:Uncharacterized protein n=1 Tax=Fuerstiella marisgermanici TaxID=1891926 RepID=A0A1P8WHW7_9PLAN|nr:hypothetical protein Fuma_03277 [Fuerstiella marisgermanici]
MDHVPLTSFNPQPKAQAGLWRWFGDEAVDAVDDQRIGLRELPAQWRAGERPPAPSAAG